MAIAVTPEQALRAYRQQVKTAEEAKKAQSTAFNAQAAILRLRQQLQYAEDRCGRLESYVVQLEGRLASVERYLSGGSGE